ncbi:hypothetical protein KRR38_08440 [Novosphingobium sp. G106]|uniref:hypothetical protein n=1 Tax=Novosphingobium sp. G106 TaxID=2849500 RepID=UPI001C2D3D3B|nr:hypothetical protein [Novosphingobium sp. G106]MBV1687701.1 hypothetical protein [Novosphingobium sp. G106]
MTAILETVRRWIERLAPAPVCDDCLAERIDMARPEDVRPAVGELAATRDFSRERGTCGLCGEHRAVIRKLK